MSIRYNSNLKTCLVAIETILMTFQDVLKTRKQYVIISILICFRITQTQVFLCKIYHTSTWRSSKCWTKNNITFISLILGGSKNFLADQKTFIRKITLILSFLMLQFFDNIISLIKNYIISKCHLPSFWKTETKNLGYMLICVFQVMSHT